MNFSDILAASCCSDLQCLFVLETTQFVDRLFSVLRSESYLPLAPSPSDMSGLLPRESHLVPLLDSDEKRLVSPTQNRKVSEDFSRQESVLIMFIDVILRISIILY